MRPPARPRVPPKPVVAKSAMSAPPKAPRASQRRPAGSDAPTAPVPRPRTGSVPRPRTAAAARTAPVPQQKTQVRGRPTVSTAMARRLAEKRAMRRHRVLKTVALWTAGAVALGAVVWALFFSPLLSLDVSRVEITGQGTTIDVAQVQGVVAEHAGVPMPRLDTIDLRNQIMDLNGVKDVEITRNWPHGLGVVLTSREPVAAVPAEDGIALVDAEGVRVGTVPERPEGLPEVEVGLGPDDAPALEAALRVLAGLPPELSSQVTHVSAATRDDVRTTLASGQVVRWGDDSRMVLKVAVVQTLQQAAPEAQVFDVSSPDLPVTR
ncbi:cell division protein FtsQ [Xylanimonas cellulosilytica DSM 15894]|uniref:Cell division protein FtsQ n=1 Tax=Xylanimonas cellulosilytica (strain DSM 15894 / JCM 12276 / CECT 5975 / KCTC 9989 / LMG 20990 / NBRC 107835 / XIL07) TaxID=446471 RepID=D1C0C8_XYLCX|nr:cell division protein FtsQ/DivIB [Xylanimonas cellulosilytica]ACZ30317.1 cell division protein FtsQ [Xylanimonas cellulosilytica DSM 15894]